MPGTSCITRVLGLRLPIEVWDRLDSLALELGSSKSELGRKAFFRGLKLMESELGIQSAEESTTAPTGQPASTSLERAVKWVLKAAERCNRRQGGSGEIPIAILWPEYQPYAPKEMDFTAFTDLLIEAQKARLIHAPDGKLVLEASAPKKKTRMTRAPAPEPPLESFAKSVLKAARKSSNKHGENRIFISVVWQEAFEDALSLDRFKDRLVEANQEGHLALARADMAPFMDQGPVEASETRQLSATFHFVCV